MTFSLFNEVFRTIQDVRKNEKQVAEALSLVVDGSTPCFKGQLEQVIIKILEDHFGDGRELMEYYLYTNTSGMTIEQLWNLLNEFGG